MSINKLIFIIVCLLLVGSVRAQDAIEDNSFLIEEAYNQEKGVIQYISTFVRTRNGDFSYNFTNEMPIKRQQHQFSYSINVIRTGGNTRFGDTYLNYRYQVMGLKKEDRVAVAPRFTLILPTGSYRNGTGSGAAGFQFDLPVSVKLSKKFVTHWNAGFTALPGARDSAGEKANIKSFNLGQSTVFLAKKNFNFLVETVWNYFESVTGPKAVKSDYSLLINPGIRWAWNFKSGLQIVPGVSAPIGAGPSRGERGLLLYLSFEK